VFPLLAIVLSGVVAALVSWLVKVIFNAGIGLAVGIVLVVGLGCVRSTPARNW